MALRLWLSVRVCWSLAHWLALIVVAGVLLAACSGDSSSTPASPTTTLTLTSSGTALAPGGSTSTPTAIVYMPPPPITTPSPSPTVAVSVLTLGTPVRALYVPGELHELYTLTVDRAQRVALYLSVADEGGPLMLRARLYGPDDTLVPQISMPNDDMPLVGVWDIPTAGTYTLQLFGPETDVRRMMLEMISQAAPENAAATIAYGEVRSGMIAVAGQVDHWTFAGQMNDRVAITMLAPYADGMLALYGPGGELIAQNDDSEQMGHSPSLEATLRVSGSHTIVVRMYGAAQTGTYQLSVQRITE